mmetsp:Transcript_25121/g.63184  ORF Transcript_25121/g.63184 Transcript_25121/m.63184 type:complete len:85 (+) Transcript_25121:5714-5968(+)
MMNRKGTTLREAPNSSSSLVCGNVHRHDCASFLSVGVDLCGHQQVFVVAADVNGVFFRPSRAVTCNPDVEDEKREKPESAPLRC